MWLSQANIHIIQFKYALNQDDDIYVLSTASIHGVLFHFFMLVYSVHIETQYVIKRVIEM